MDNWKRLEQILEDNANTAEELEALGLLEAARKELELLRQLANQVEPFVRHWPLAGAGHEAMEAFRLLIQWKGESAVAESMLDAIESGVDQTTERMVAWIEEKYIKRIDPRCREQFIEEIRAGEFLR